MLTCVFLFLYIATAYRRVLKPFTFSDGTLVPAGTRIAIAAHSTHLDEAIYPEAKTFQGFRFAKMMDNKGQSSQMVTASQDYLPFGVGRHMWLVYIYIYRDYYFEAFLLANFLFLQQSRQVFYRRRYESHDDTCSDEL